MSCVSQSYFCQIKLETNVYQQLNGTKILKKKLIMKKMIAKYWIETIACAHSL